MPLKEFFFWSNHLLDFTSGVHLQCCVSFRYTAECFSYTYTYIYYFSVSFLFFFFPSFSPSAVEETHIIAPSGATASSSLQLQQVFNMAQHRYASCCCSKTEFLLLSPEFPVCSFARLGRGGGEVRVVLGRVLLPLLIKDAYLLNREIHNILI